MKPLGPLHSAIDTIPAGGEAPRPASGSLRRTAIRRSLGILTCLYPALIFACKGSAHFKEIALGIGALLIFTLMVRVPKTTRYGLLGAGALVSLTMLVLGVNNLERLYPFLMSASMLVIFASFRDPEDNPMIGPLRKRVLADPNLLNTLQSARWIWVVGLSVNTAVLGVLLFAFKIEVWLLYASLYSYLLLAFLFIATIGYVAQKRQRLR